MESLHPAVVHFPIALILTAFFLESVALLGKKGAVWHQVSLWNLRLGALGAAAAVITGRLAEAVAKHSFEIHQIMELHERLGYIVLGLVTVVALWRWVMKDRLSVGFRWVAWGLLGAACGIMAWSAHLGGRMVYEFGVGGQYGHSGGIQVVQ